MEAGVAGMEAGVAPSYRVLMVLILLRLVTLRDGYKLSLEGKSKT